MADEIVLTVRYKVHNANAFTDAHGAIWTSEDIAEKIHDDAMGLFTFGAYRKAASKGDRIDVDVDVDVRPGLMWNDHKRDDGAWCRWSGVTVRDTAPEKCPHGCRTCTRVEVGR